MNLKLRPHPGFPAPPGIAVETAARRRGQTLLLHYRLVGDTSVLLLPGTSEPLRSDELWRHSCFEAFVQPAGSDFYVELNFSPSTQWAAYRFDGYRGGMAEYGAEPRIARVERGLDVSVELDLPGTWRVGLTAVLEASDGSLSYWALRHPPGRPDFHHRDCFAHEVAPAG